MRVENVMSPKVIGVSENSALWDALELMTRERVSALVVFDASGAPVGVLSEGDLMRRGELGTQKSRPGWLDFLLGEGRAARDYAHSHGRRVGEIMSRGLISIGEEAELAEAVDLMLSRRVKRLVVTRDDKAIGILARHDVLRALFHALPPETAARSDGEIEAAINAELEHHPWAPTDSIRVVVVGGVVTLEGAIADYSLREGLRVLAENSPGVKEVRDHLAWVEPHSGYVVPGIDDPNE
jgi:CBS domain-containing protein